MAAETHADSDEIPDLIGVSRPRPTFVLTRALFLRLLGAIYLVAFLSLARQLLPLLGEHGLQPAARFLERYAATMPSRGAAAWHLPTLFWLGCSDALMQGLAWLGVGLSAAVVLGAGNALVMLALWALYLSFTHVGQLFYGFGWEALTVETGFLAIFLCPLTALRPGRMEPPRLVVYLLRWLLFRLILGAGLIKIRGDACWRDLTCLDFHYQTQPLPNPLSWLLHQSPPWFHRLEVLWNHVVELLVPWLLFAPQRVARVAGLIQIAFQVTLILSGNLSWLNWLTLTIVIACLDDAFLLRLAPARTRARLVEAIAAARPSRTNLRLSIALALLVGVLSVNPVANMASSEQVMNTGFDPFELVNTYGAFGHIGRTRPEIVLEGTLAERPDEGAAWREYQLPCKPGDVRRRPCVVAPYQLRLDWEIWFAAMSDYQHHPWLVRLVYKLLRGDRTITPLLGEDPFPDRPPRFVRARLYEYRFTRWGEPGGAWWSRTLVGEWLPAVSLDDPTLAPFLEESGYPVD